MCCSRRDSGERRGRTTIQYSGAGEWTLTGITATTGMVSEHLKCHHNEIFSRGRGFLWQMFWHISWTRSFLGTRNSGHQRLYIETVGREKRQSVWPPQYCNNYQVWQGEIFQQHAQLLPAGPPILGLHQHPTGQLHAVCEYQTSLASSSLTTSSTRWRRRGSQHSRLSMGLSSGQWCFDSYKIRGKKQSEDYLL